MVETNIIIKKEYRELINLLNIGNKLRNEKTGVYFYIEKSDGKYRLFAAINQKQKLQLCVMGVNQWHPLKQLQFENLAMFISRLVGNRVDIDSDLLTELIRNAVFFIDDLS